MPVAPLVSCIMPTKDRRAFVAQAIHYYLRQSYENRELIIIDDGIDSIDDLVPPSRNVFCTLLSGTKSISDKRNLACEQARGKYIVHWDDDDWQHPRRIAEQVEALEQTRADVCGLDSEIYLDVRTREVRRYTLEDVQPHSNYVPGNSLAYTRAFWDRKRFGVPGNIGEDSRFVMEPPVARVVKHVRLPLVVGIVHDDNVSPKRFTSKVWKADVTPGLVREIMGRDYAFYRQLGVQHGDPACQD